MPHPFSVPAEAFAAAWKAIGLKGGAPQGLRVYRDLMRRGETRACPPPWTTPDALAPQVIDQLRSESNEGEVVKLLFEIQASATGASAAERDAASLGKTLPIESVVIPMRGRSGNLNHTLCVSSQVGCAMGCDFCETAQMGLIRNLSVEQIVAQWWRAQHDHCLPHGKTLTNIVFMGMGEPLDNIDNVLGAIAVLTDRNGPNVAMSKITISTVGRVDGLRTLAEKRLEHGYRRLGIAVSLNAPNDEIRNQIMPINRKYDMAELRDVLVNFPRAGQNKLMIEYVLIPGVNDAPEHADQLADWAEPLPCCVNVIPYNPRRGSPWPAPTEQSVEDFCNRVKSHGRFVKRRRTKGRETMAACGQLGTEHIRKRKLISPTISRT